MSIINYLVNNWVSRLATVDEADVFRFSIYLRNLAQDRCVPLHVVPLLTNKQTRGNVREIKLNRVPFSPTINVFSDSSLINRDLLHFHRQRVRIESSASIQNELWIEVSCILSYVSTYVGRTILFRSAQSTLTEQF